MGSEDLLKKQSSLVEYLWRVGAFSRGEIRALLEDSPASSGPPFLSAQTLKRGRQVLKDFWTHPGTHPPRFSYLTFLDPEYPSHLQNLHDPPCVLYYQGDLKLLGKGLKVAVVGTRNASWQALEACEFLVQEMLPYRPLILSGMARGIDGMAHRSALRLGLPTVGVLGTPLDRIFPWEHRHLHQEMAEKALLLSEVFPGAPMGPWRFPERNRILAALAHAVIVVEAPARSGALVTAKLALDLGREVFVVPGPLTGERNAGGHFLIQEGAPLLTHPRQLFEALRVPQALGPIAKQETVNNSPPLIDGDQSHLLEILVRGPLHIDKIIAISHLAAPLVASALMELCLNGRISELPGRVFKINQEFQ